MTTVEMTGERIEESVIGNPVPARSLLPPTLWDRVVSVWLWTASIAWAAVVLPLTTFGCLIIGLDRMMPFQRLYTWGGLKAVGVDWHYVVDPKVDPKQAYLFAHNHTHLFDFLLLHNATPHYKLGVELEEHYKIPLYGWFMKARGGIAVKRGQKGQSAEVLAQAKKSTNLGRGILVFPEGTRTRDGRVGRFKTGSFFIARDLGIPVCPVTAVGAYDMMRKGSLIVRPAKVTMYVDAPIETAGLSDDELVALAERVQGIVGERLDAEWRSRGWKG
jgi:1-acyl-sn-glycerol-3-phosphate acyltransferase